MKKPAIGVRSGVTARSFRAGGYSVLAAVLVIAIAVVVNILVEAIPARYTQVDVTSSQLFSISQQTEEIISGLSQDVTVYWVVQSGNEDATLELLLDQYASMSSHLKVVKKDPDASPGFTTEYGLQGVYNNSLVVESDLRYQYVSYDSIYSYDYSDYYTSGGYSTSFGGESALTGAIYYVTSETLPKVYTLTGHGELDIDSSFTSAMEQEGLAVEDLYLLSEEGVPEDADCVLIYGPQSDISQEEQEMLEEYLQSGGRLLLIADTPQDRNERPNLEALMAQYGMESVEGIVLEQDYGYSAMGTPYYLLPDIAYHEITSPLQDAGYYVLLPVSQGLRASETLDEDLSVSELLTTSDSAFSKASGYSMSTYEKEEGDIDGPFALALAAERTLDEDTSAKVVWVSSTSLLDSQTNSQVSGGNQDFFLNCLGYLCEQESSISIHAKSMSYDYLTMSSMVSLMLTVLMVGIVPLLYLLFGIRIWYRRKCR